MLIFVVIMFNIQHVQTTLICLVCFNQQAGQFQCQWWDDVGLCGTVSWLWLLSAVHIDISRVFNSVLPQQCQSSDSFTGAPTVCAIYTKWLLFTAVSALSVSATLLTHTHPDPTRDITAPLTYTLSICLPPTSYNWCILVSPCTEWLLTVVYS